MTRMKPDLGLEKIRSLLAAENFDEAYRLLHAKEFNRSRPYLDYYAAVCFKLTKFKEARACYEQLHSLDERQWSHLYNAALCCLELEDERRAKDYAAAALALNPKEFHPRILYARILTRLGKYRESAMLFEELLSVNCKTLECYRGYLDSLRRFAQPNKVEMVHLEALSKYPNAVDLRNNLGILYLNCGKHLEARQQFLHALSYAPHHGVHYFNLGNVEMARGRLKSATGLYGVALVKELNKSEEISVVVNLAHSLERVGEIELSHKVISHGLSRFPGDKHLIDNLCIYSTYLKTYPKEYAEALSHYKNLSFERNERGGSATADKPEVLNKRKRIRIGFVSGDLKAHPVSYFLRPVLRHLDRDRFELVIFDNTPKSDEVSRWLKKDSHEWVSIKHLKDNEAFEIIRTKNIDILIDLSGHTAHNRLSLFAMRPCRRQASWLGYWNSTGLREMDYFLTSEMVVPPTLRTMYTEEVIYIPRIHLCFGSPNINRFEGKRQRNITYGSFNRLAKLNDGVINLWARLLNSDADSDLLLQDSALIDQYVRTRILKKFVALGVSPSRIRLAPLQSYQQYLASVRDVGAVLDPFPFSGGTTSAEAIALGVPVVTLLNENPAGRQTAAFLTCVGHRELIAQTETEYIETAMLTVHGKKTTEAWANDLQKGFTKSPLGNALEFQRYFGKVLRELI
jgi:protein O-GlcNAc transferase